MGQSRPGLGVRRNRLHLFKQRRLARLSMLFNLECLTPQPTHMLAIFPSHHHGHQH